MSIDHRTSSINGRQREGPSSDYVQRKASLYPAGNALFLIGAILARAILMNRQLGNFGLAGSFAGPFTAGSCVGDCHKRQIAPFPTLGSSSSTGLLLARYFLMHPIALSTKRSRHTHQSKKVKIDRAVVRPVSGTRRADQPFGLHLFQEVQLSGCHRSETTSQLLRTHFKYILRSRQFILSLCQLFAIFKISLDCP